MTMVVSPDLVTLLPGWSRAIVAPCLPRDVQLQPVVLQRGVPHCAYARATGLFEVNDDA
jgi:hypothetical protein